MEIEINIEQAIAMMSITWVLTSWATRLVKPTAPINKFICTKCWSFWLTLGATFNPFTAALAALLAVIAETIINNQTTKL